MNLYIVMPDMVTSSEKKQNKTKQNVEMAENTNDFDFDTPISHYHLSILR